MRILFIVIEMNTGSFLEIHKKVRKSLFCDYISGIQLEKSATNIKSINFLNPSLDQVNTEQLIQYMQISRGIGCQPVMTLKSSAPKETKNQQSKAMANNNSMIRSHKKKKYQPKVAVKKLRKSIMKRTCNKKATEKPPKRDSTFITSTPNWHKTLSDENSAINCTSFSLEEDFSSSDSEPLINIIPTLSKAKRKTRNTFLSQKRISFDDSSIVNVMNNKKNTVDEGANSLKRSKQKLISKKTRSSGEKENSVINNTKNGVKEKENRRLEGRKTVNRKSPIKKNKIAEKIANRGRETRLQSKSIELSLKQPHAVQNENIQPPNTNHISKNGAGINSSYDDNKALGENTEKNKVKQTTNRLKELKPDKNKNVTVEDKNIEVIQDNSDKEPNNLDAPNSSDSEPLINIIPSLNKAKTKTRDIILSQRRISYDDSSIVNVMNNKKNTVEEAPSNSLKRNKQELICKKTRNSGDKENTAINNIENVVKEKENRRLEDRKTVNRKSPVKKNKITEKIENAGRETRLQSKSIELSFKQPHGVQNENIHPPNTNHISKNGARINSSYDDNKVLGENTEKNKVKQTTNQLKELKPDKNKNITVEDKNIEVIKDNSNKQLNNPHAPNVEPINAENIVTESSTIPKKPVVEIVPPKDILADVLFLPPVLKEKYKSLRASSTSKKNSNERKESFGSELNSTATCSFNSDVMITGEMGPDLVHDMSLSVQPDWHKNIMKTTKENKNIEATMKRKPEDTNEQYLLRRKKRKLMTNCSLPITEKTRTDFDFFQKVATCPELKSLISKFHFEIYLHEQLNSIKNELRREDTKWKINLLVRRALLKDKGESK